MDSHHPVFDTTELLHAILQYVDHPKTLKNFACVSRRWFHDAITILWKGSSKKKSLWRTPDFKHLIVLAKRPRRFRFYMRFVDKLILEYDEKVVIPRKSSLEIYFERNLWRSFKGSMLCIDLGSQIQNHEELVRSLIKPSLKSLQITHGKYSDAFFQYLNDHCSLRLFTITDCDDISLEVLHKFIEYHPLEYLDVHGKKLILNHATYNIALAKSNLLYLNLASSNFPQADFQAHEIGGVCSNLRSLCIEGYSPNLEHLFECLPNLQAFSIFAERRHWDLVTHLLRPIAICHQLRELYLYCEFEITATDFIQFAKSSPSIEIFELYGEKDYALPSSEILGALENWPNLWCFTFRCPLTNSTKAEISRLAKSCPNLRLLTMYSCVTRDAFDETITFPQLISVDFEAMFCESNTASVVQVEEWVTMFRKAMTKSMPRLQSINAHCLSVRYPHSGVYRSEDADYPYTIDGVEITNGRGVPDDWLESVDNKPRHKIEYEPY